MNELTNCKINRILKKIVHYIDFSPFRNLFGFFTATVPNRVLVKSLLEEKVPFEMYF